MADLTLYINHPERIGCRDAVVGSSIYIYLNPDSFTQSVIDNYSPVTADIIEIRDRIGGEPKADLVYEVVTTTDLPPGILSLSQCDISGYKCLSCCDELLASSVIGIPVYNEDDLIEAAAANEAAVTIVGMIEITKEVDLSGWQGEIARTSPEYRIVDSGGYFTFDGFFNDFCKPAPLFDIARPGQLRFYSRLVGGVPPAGYVLNPSPSGTHTQAYTDNYVRPFLAGRFDNVTRKAYMFGGEASDTSDWNDSFVAIHNSLPPSGGAGVESIYRQGTMELDRGDYYTSSTVLVTKAKHIKGYENSGFTGGIATRIFPTVGFANNTGRPDWDFFSSTPFIIDTCRASDADGVSHNSQFMSRLSDICARCEKIANGIRFSGSEFSGIERVSSDDSVQYGFSFAAGSNNTSIKDTAVRRDAGDPKGGTVAYNFEGLNRHITILNGKVNNFETGARIGGGRPYNITVIGTGFESVTKLVTAGVEAGSVSFLGCSLHTDALDGDPVVEFNSVEEPVLTWTGHLSRNAGTTTEEPPIEFQSREFNLLGDPYITPRVDAGEHFEVNINLDERDSFINDGVQTANIADSSFSLFDFSGNALRVPDGGGVEIAIAGPGEVVKLIADIDAASGAVSSATGSLSGASASFGWSVAAYVSGSILRIQVNNNSGSADDFTAMVLNSIPR